MCIQISVVELVSLFLFQPFSAVQPAIVEYTGETRNTNIIVHSDLPAG